MYGRHQCLLTCTYIVLLLLSHVLASDDHIFRDGRLMAYKGGERAITGEYAKYATNGIAAGALVGTEIGTAVGTIVPVVGNVLGGALGAIFGGITGFVGGTIYYGVVKNWCDNQCAEYFACVLAEKYEMKCCQADFGPQCYSDWREIEAKYPRLTTPRPTTTRSTPPPRIATSIAYWAETFAGPGTKEDPNFAKVTTFWCKRGRDNAKEYLVALNTCPYESNQCYFVYCQAGNSGEWGCVPKNATDFCGRVSSTKEMKCQCHLGSPGVAMGNEVLVN